MSRGEARLGPLSVAWEVPDDLPDATGGLEHLPSIAGASIRATWLVRGSAPGPPPDHYAAFYGAARLALGPDAVRVWSPAGDFVVRSNEVSGGASGPCSVAASLALHALAAGAGLAHVHAALVRLGGRIVLAPGGSGAGKTSMALAVGRHGGELLADDAVYVESDGTAWPIRRDPRVTATTLAAHAGVSVLGTVDDGVLPKLRVRAPTAGPAMPAAIDAIVIPTIEPSGPTRVERIDAAAVFPVLLGSSALAVVEGTPRREGMIDLLAALAAIPAARLLAGPDALADPARIPRAIEAWLR